MFTITTEHNDDRLAGGGTLGFLNRGTGAAYLEVYEGARPGTPTGSLAGRTLLTTFYFDRPAGALVDHALVLSASLVSFVVATGTPQFGRLYNGEGTPGGDLDVTGIGGGGDVEIEVDGSGKVYAGGATAIFSAVFT